MESLDCAVVGAGVVGLAVARRLALAGRDVLVLEAESEVGQHTSSRSSDVIHAGIYHPPGWLKARLCVAGNRALYAYMAEHNVSHCRIGKILIAVSEAEVVKLERCVRQAEANGVQDLVTLSAAQVRSLEPAIVAVRGVLSPSTGIVDCRALMGALRADLEAAGGRVQLSSPVTGGQVQEQGILLDVGGAHGVRVCCKAMVNSAGFRAPSVARALKGLHPRFVPGEHFARGQYFRLAGSAPFQHLIYPMPAPGAVGIHVTLDLAGGVRFGPSTTWIGGPQYDFDADEAQMFYAAVRRYFPGLEDGALESAYVGIRSKIVPEGMPAADFAIQGPEVHGIAGLVNLFGIESPGLTACLAIADEVVTRLGWAP